MRIQTHFVLSLIAMLAAVPFAPAQAEAPPWPTQGWTTSTPEEQGMDSAALARLVSYGAKHSMDSLVVVRHGRIVAEAYYAPYTGDFPHEIFSCTKAITGTLIGMVSKDGLLDRLDHPMLDFFGDRRVANLDDRKKAITVQNLLNMTSGLDWDQGYEGGKEQTLAEVYRSPDWIQFILDRPMAHPPGEFYNYSNGDANLASAIVTKLTGKLSEDYARQRLFAPLGISDWHWDRDPRGLTIGDGMLALRPRDMAKIGYLYLHHGEWDGQRLLPAGWADVLDHKSVNMHASDDPTQSYSNFFWIFPEKHVFMATGLRGQLIAVFPDLDVVAVTNAHKYVKFGALIDGIIEAAKSETALPPNASAQARLDDAIKDAAIEKPSTVGPTPELASAISGKTYQFPDNAVGIKSFLLDLTSSRPHFELEIHSLYPTAPWGLFEAPIGLDGLYAKGSPALFGPNPGHRPAAKGAWRDARTFVIDELDEGWGEQRQFVLTFGDDKLNIRFSNTDRPERALSLGGQPDN